MGADQSTAETQLDNYHELEDYYARKLTGTHSSLTNLFSLAEESSCSLSTPVSLSEKAIPHPNGLEREVTMHSTTRCLKGRLRLPVVFRKTHLQKNGSK